MKFSVVIPLFNGEKFIKQTLDSVRAQTFRDFEIIVVDDGSTDEAYKLLSQYKDITLLQQKNGGPGNAKNLGMLNAKGDYIALLDQDDIWYPEKLEEVSKIDADVIYHAQNVSRSGIILKTQRARNYTDMLSRLFWRNDLSGSTVCFRRRLIKEIGGFAEDLKFLEDYDLWLRMAESLATFHYIDKLLGERIIHEGNFSNQIAIMRKNELRVIRKYFGGWNWFRFIRLAILHCKYIKQYIWSYLTLT